MGWSEGRGVGCYTCNVRGVIVYPMTTAPRGVCSNIASTTVCVGPLALLCLMCSLLFSLHTLVPPWPPMSHLTTIPSTPSPHLLPGTCLQSFENAVASDDPVPQILYDVFNARTGNPVPGIGLQIILILGVFFCLMATYTYVAR